MRSVPCVLFQDFTIRPILECQSSPSQSDEKTADPVAFVDLLFLFDVTKQGSRKSSDKDGEYLLERNHANYN